MGKFNDLTGRRFGRLIVIERAEDYISPKGKRVTRWSCRCDCNNEVVIRRDALMRGAAQSCGCRQREMASKANKKYNTYDLSREYGIGYTFNGEEFYFDLEDYDLIKDYCWHISSDGYVMAYDNKTKSNISFHKLLFPLSEVVDHIKHIRCDNRKHELRACTQKENNRNRSMTPSDTSGVVGVRKAENGKWDAKIQVDGKYHTKRFDNFDDAVAYRKKMEEEFFGEFSYEKSMSL